MLKRSFSERGHSAHVRAFGVKVLPSTFQMPPLRVTGFDVKNRLPEDSTWNDISNGLPSDHYPVSNGEANDRHGNGVRRNGKATALARYIDSHSFDGLDLEELTESERDLKIDYELVRAEHNIQTAYEVGQAEREQNRSVQEVVGLDDILQMCTDYEQQLQRENQTRQSLVEKRNASRLCSMSKIKTNGSLTSPIIHSRRFVAIPTERHWDWHLLPRAECSSAGGAHPSLDRSTVEQPTDSEWSNGEEPLSSTSSSEFLDKSTSAANRSQSLYENDEVFATFQTGSSSSPGFNGHDALHDGGELPVHQSSLLQHLTSRSTGVALPSRQPLPTARNLSDGDKPHGISDRKRYSGDQRLNLEKTKLTKMKMESAERIGRTKNRIIEIDELQEKVIKELEHELAMVLTDSAEVLDSLRLEEERVAVIKEQQMELLLQAARERQEVQRRIDAERRKLEEMEAVHRKSSERLECTTSAHIEPLLQQTVEIDKDAVDAQLRTFDDLEFSLLELETRREEEREPMQKKLTTELDSLLQLKTRREETLRLIEKQKVDVLEEANTDVTKLEKERYVLMRAFKKEKLIYLAIIDQISRLAVLLTSSNDEVNTGTGSGHGEDNGCGGWDNHPDLCKTPPMRVRIRQTLVDLEQEHLPSSVQHLKNDGVIIVAGRGLDSEGSQEVNGDVSPASKVFSSCSEDSSFEGVAKEDTNRLTNGNDLPCSPIRRLDPTSADVASKSHERLSLASREEKEEEKRREAGNQQGGGGGRALARSLSEPRKTGRLELNSKDTGSMTDDEIRLRENQRTQARPLTRYLPVRDKNLDLRCFVESSGHSLDETSQVLVSASTCCGYLKKQGGKFRTWHKRWFVFDRNRRCLAYYVDRTEAKLRRSVYFQSIRDVFIDRLSTVVSPNRKLTFCLKTIDRSYYLLAPTAEAMRIWIDVLFTGAEGYQEFC